MADLSKGPVGTLKPGISIIERLQTYEMWVRCTTTTDMLATGPDAKTFEKYLQLVDKDGNPVNPDTLEQKQKELAALPSGVDENGEEQKMALTVFPTDEQGRRFMWPYQIRGFCKEAASFLIKAGTQKADEDEDGGSDGAEAEAEAAPVELDKNGKPKKAKKKAAPKKFTTLSAKHKSAYVQNLSGLVFFGPERIYINLPEGEKPGINIRPIVITDGKGRRTAIACSNTVPAGSWFDVHVRTLRPEFLDLVLEWFAYGELHGFLQWRNAGYGRFTTQVYQQ